MTPQKRRNYPLVKGELMEELLYWITLDCTGGYFKGSQ